MIGDLQTVEYTRCSVSNSNQSDYYQRNRKARLKYQHRYNREHYAEIKIKNRLRYRHRSRTKQ